MAFLPTTPIKYLDSDKGNVYGCHNRGAFVGGAESECQYTLSALGKVDPRCIGCNWAINEIENPEFNLRGKFNDYQKRKKAFEDAREIQALEEQINNIEMRIARLKGRTNHG